VDGDSSFDAIVLAGGAARRMGNDKALSDVGGRSLIDRALDAVADAQRIVVVGPQRAVSRVVTWTIEDPPGSGPAAALVHALPMTAAGRLVVLAVDVPFAASALPRLLAALADHEAAMLVDHTGRRQPLVAAYAAQALRERALPEHGSWANRSMRDLVAGLDVVDVAAHGVEALDCDTPAALAEARAAVATVPSPARAASRRRDG
jgi:molybdopterin-guanine dinucleotide biosynthesis protein A